MTIVCTHTVGVIVVVRGIHGEDAISVLEKAPAANLAKRDNSVRDTAEGFTRSFEEAIVLEDVILS